MTARRLTRWSQHGYRRWYCAAPTVPSGSAYAMVCFTESTNLGDGTDHGLHLAVSPDGLNWTPLPEQPPGHPHRRRAEPARPVPDAQAGRRLVNSEHRGVATITTAEYDNLLVKRGVPAKDAVPGWTGYPG